MSVAAIAELLETGPLYRKVEIEKQYCHPDKLGGITFQFFCQKEAANRTFKLVMAPEKAIEKLSHRDYEQAFEPFVSDEAVDFFQYYVGHCQSCNQYSVHFLLQVFSEGTFLKVAYDTTKIYFQSTGGTIKLKEMIENDQSKLYLRKAGQWPSVQIKPDAILYKFLDDEDRTYYSKALICLSQSYGVAAFAYMRRIVEKEIIRIVEELINDSTGNSAEIKKLLLESKEKKQMSILIDNLFPHLPSSLKVLNDNPIKLLYGYLSDGLHNQSDDVCQKKAIALDKLLQFTVKRLREDQTEVKEIKEVMKGLRSDE